MILDYLTEYSDAPFEDEPLNTLDLLAFTALSYFDFPQGCQGSALPAALPRARHFTVPDPHAPHPRLIRLDRSHDEQLRELISRALRYEGVSIHGFTSDFVDDSHQFGAVSFLIDDVLVVAFRGTDESITGWREALELSLDVPRNGQLLAKEFLAQQAAETSGPIITCGHSKGGNLAAFAAFACAQDPVVANRIAAVLSFDGPGLSEDMRASASYKRIESRIRAYIPKSSFIGNIHEHPVGSVEYVDSDEVFVAQHFIYSWKTSGTHLVPCKQSLTGKIGSGALNVLIDNMADAQKNVLFDALFYIPKRLSLCHNRKEYACG